MLSFRKNSNQEHMDDNLSMVDSLYQEQILDHNSNPRNKYIIQDENVIQGIGDNPSCGDSGKLYILLDKNNIIIESSFVGEGCAISQAGLSMMTNYLKGKNIQEIKTTTPGAIYTMLGINISPARVLCALLCYNALQNIIKNYEANI